MENRAGNTDTARSGQPGGAAVGQHGIEVMSHAVIFDHRAIAVGASVQAGALAVGRDGVAEQAGHGHAIGQLAAGGEQ